MKDLTDALAVSLPIFAAVKASSSKHSPEEALNLHGQALRHVKYDTQLAKLCRQFTDRLSSTPEKRDHHFVPARTLARELETLGCRCATKLAPLVPTA